MASLGVVAAPPGRGSGRPKSAGIFPSSNRKLVAARTSDNSKPKSSQRPRSSRHPRPPSTSVVTSPRPRPCNVSMQLWRQPGPQAPTRHNSVVQRVVRDEIDEQRQVTLEAQRQLHELHATITRREEELSLAQRHLHAFSSSTESASPSSNAKPEIVSNLKLEIAHQDAYKKRLRYLHERLEQQVRYLEANADLLAERKRAAHRERTLCRNRIKVESDKNRHTQQQLCALHDKRAGFKRSALPIIESYRDELASRLVITQRRNDADRRRDELLRFIGTRADGSKVTSRSLTSASAAMTRGRVAGKMQRRESYNVLVDDADENRRETLFAVYEGQYARVLRETGEVDLNVVLDRFQSYRESTARLREIEAELRTESARLAREQQAHNALASRLRVSGPGDITERRQRLRDRLEGALHAQQLDKSQARDRMNTQLKAFAFAQQGVLHIVELLLCLDERPGGVIPGQVAAIARTVMGGRRGLQREWLKLAAIDYSAPQVARLEQFEFDSNQKSNNVGMKETRSESDEEIEEEMRDAVVMRRAIKRQEKETLRQAETILRQTYDARKLLQMQQLHQQRKLQSSTLLQERSDVEIVAAHFREQRRIEKQEQRLTTGIAPSTGPLRNTMTPYTAIAPAATQSPRRKLN
ncbi:hypothetical protein PInf_002456 [Phytophthora infestans]|nr:hypothetical protein PInf_002456 [Phytophthora infestans]